ncbi:MAG: alpha-1,2-fucosyltransferase [Luteolibacter sp.]|uniref:alpha-1,2-fucosyltransferase n=1 Tax=Luteolibacter sp. TaxID=1962973 RepID=UPI00326766D8
MIRIVLLGRTGNHLFQYALGRVLAKKHGVPLVMDASWFNAEGWAEVSHFLKLPLKAKVVRRVSLATRALRKVTGRHYWEYRKVPVLRENPDDQSFEPGFLDVPADCMLFGYFQTPLYFQGIDAELRDELNHLLSASVQPPAPIREKLSDPNSVAVHVRRRDYLTLQGFLVCDSQYYRDRMDQMRTRLGTARFHIFSDDPEWCRSEFQRDDEIVMDSGNDAVNPLHDLYLMSLASHHVIANSTYSWWAAWLGKKEGQQVLMPDRWYASGPKAPIHEKRMPGWR